VGLPPFGDAAGQGWDQRAELGPALVLSAVIGPEREVRHMVRRRAGRARRARPVADRGAGRVRDRFIGGGLIFVRRDAVRGLTTAAVG
jgi:putative Mg2+ transporter-C (MgtC) family protein